MGSDSTEEEGGMNCKHSTIQAWRTVDTHEPVMWACAECREKFVPISQLEAEVKAAREGCASTAEHMLWEDGTEIASAIRAGNE